MVYKWTRWVVNFCILHLSWPRYLGPPASCRVCFVLCRHKELDLILWKALSYMYLHWYRSAGICIWNWSMRRVWWGSIQASRWRWASLPFAWMHVGKWSASCFAQIHIGVRLLVSDMRGGSLIMWPNAYRVVLIVPNSSLYILYFCKFFQTLDYTRRKASTS